MLTNTAMVFALSTTVASHFIRTHPQGPFVPTNQIGVVLRLRILLGATTSFDHPIDSRTPVVDQAKRRTPAGTGRNDAT